MEKLAEEHDIIIADCGAAKQVLSSTLFAAHCDVVLLVLRRGIPLAEARSAAAAVLATSRKQVLVVLTGQPSTTVPAWAMNAANRAGQTMLAPWPEMQKITGQSGKVEHEFRQDDEAPRHQAKRLLLIDDDPVVAEILLLRIKDSCPMVEADAISDPVAPPGYDIYVVDIDFGGKQEGVRLAEAIATASPGATVFMLSSFLEVAVLKRVMGVQCRGAFDKREPEDIAALLRADCRGRIAGSD